MHPQCLPARRLAPTCRAFAVSGPAGTRPARGPTGGRATRPVRGLPPFCRPLSGPPAASAPGHARLPIARRGPPFCSRPSMACSRRESESPARLHQSLDRRSLLVRLPFSCGRPESESTVLSCDVRGPRPLVRPQLPSPRPLQARPPCPLAVAGCPSHRACFCEPGGSRPVQAPRRLAQLPPDPSGTPQRLQRACGLRAFISRPGPWARPGRRPASSELPSLNSKSPGPLGAGSNSSAPLWFQSYLLCRRTPRQLVE